MKQKTPVYRNLRSIPVYFEDTSLTSDEIFRITEFPLRLTAGKNIFKLQGNPNNLNNGSYLNIEILDYNGNPIYNEVTSVITEDNSRIISIYVYEDTSPGDAEVTLVTTANTLFGQDIPTEWKDKPNVRWSRRVPINPTLENVSEIIFNELPTLTLKEQVGVQLNRTYSTIQYPVYTTGKVQYISKNSQPILIISGGSFNSQMVGGIVTIPAPNNPKPNPYYSAGIVPYLSTIKKVLSTSSIVLDTEYKIASSESIIPHTYNAFNLSSYSIEYEATPTYIPTQNSESYALIEIDNLEPVSGDVSRIKVFMNNTGTVGTWELINDIALEETDIFVTNTASVEPYKSIGNIVSQTIINTYYTASSYLGKIQQTAPILVYENTELSNALKISSTADLSARNRVHILQTTSSAAGKFIKGASYKVTLDAIGTKTIATGDTAPNISIYMSGSAFKYDYLDYYNQELPVSVGKKIGDLYVNNDSQRFDDETFYFDADDNGVGVLVIVIKGGEWKLSDIRTTTDNDMGFTPAYTRIRSLVPTPHKSNVQFSFKVEYYNVDGAKSKQINYIDNISWEGGNRYVDGEYSMITGSLYVADSLENGIAISGYKDTGYIRSLGYDGFNAGYPGFLIWSGSAMKASSTTYSGVGLELYADRDNYFRYRTNPSELVVKTKSFYFGSSSQYISGSNGSLVISSSNFYLDPSGNVTLSGVVNITGGSGFATPSSVSASINTATGSLSASLNTTINANSASAASALSSVSSSTADRIVTDAANKIVKPNDTPGGGAGLYLSQKYLGYYNASAWNAYISSSGEFLFKKDDNNLISFGGSPTAFTLKVSDAATISGSNINLITPNFFFGNNTQFISGSNGNLQIKSNNFNVSSNGAVTASNIYLEDVAIADSFVYNTVTVNNSNYTQYYENYTITDLLLTGSVSGYSTRQFTKLVLDGSLGGQSGKQVRIERLPDYPIGMIMPGGYSSGSNRGFEVIIENWALNNNGSFSALLFATAVASGSTTNKGNTDFGFFADMWDKSATSYQSYPATYINLQTLDITSGSVYYGEGALGVNQTYKPTTSDILASQILALYYGNQFAFQRTVATTLPSGYGLQDKYFQLVYSDSNITLNTYFPGGFKSGGGVLMGGSGSANPFSRNSIMHGDSGSNNLAILELRPDTRDANQYTGTHTLFIPPVVSDTFITSVFTYDFFNNPFPPTPPLGAMYFSSTTNKLKVWDGSTWQSCW